MGCAWSSADLTGDGVRIRVIKEIAHGGFSQVYLCEDIDSREKYAVKKIQINQSGDEEKIQFEAEQHRLLAPSSANIVPLLACIELDSALHLVFPYYKRGTVADTLAMRRKDSRYLPQTEVVKFALNMCSAVQVVHSLQIAHRDLKTANFMIGDDGSALLIDFGSAMNIPLVVSDSRSRQRMIDDCAEHCSMPYRAPELFSCDIGTKLDEKVDLWSLGCCLYALCFFVSPFDIAYERGDSVALAAQSPDKINYPAETPYEEELKEVIRSLLKVEPEDRLPLPEIVARLDKLKGNIAQNGGTQIV